MAVLLMVFHAAVLSCITQVLCSSHCGEIIIIYNRFHGMMQYVGGNGIGYLQRRWSKYGGVKL